MSVSVHIVIVRAATALWDADASAAAQCTQNDSVVSARCFCYEYADAPAAAQ